MGAGMTPMEDIKVQLTHANIAYKKRLGLSFAQIINTLLQMSEDNPDIEQELLARIKSKQSADR